MTTITLPRAVVEQALEAMRCGVPTGKITLYAWDKALSDLVAALAQEPHRDIRVALQAPGCERLREWFEIGPVQRAALETFVAALAQEQAEPVADLRCAKWLDPECADKGACQSLRFKRQAALAQEQAEPNHETRAELAEQQVVQLAEERDHYRNLWQKTRQAEQTWVCPDSPEHRYKKPGHCEDCGKTLVLAQHPGCDHCNHPLYAATKCRVCGRVTEPKEGGNLPPPLQDSAVAEAATTQQQLADTPPSDYQRGYWDGFNIGKREGRIEAEDAAKQAEPVAWMDIDRDGQRLSVRMWSDGNRDEVPLYTAPPKAEPLTDDEIRDLWSWSMTAEAERTGTTQQHAFARAIERAHGIGDNT